jgi:leader peptidase (prepilin peptidase)/N-methyltransferase
MTSALPLELAVFFLGLLFGSFLNVCISRLPRAESIARPRSRCPQCLEPIRWYDNVPLLSWILLAAKCRNCKASIPWRYPLVELSTGLWFAVSAGLMHHRLLVTAAANQGSVAVQAMIDGIGISVLGFLLIGLMVMDWQTQILPDAFTLTGTALGFILSCVHAALLGPGEGDIHLSPRNNLRMSSPGSFAAKGDVFLTGPEAMVLGRLFAILAATGVLLLIRGIYKALRNREGIGLGDAKLLAMTAAFLGFWDSMLSFFVGMIACAVYAVYLLARRRANATTKLPLGSFLAAGGLVTALVGEALIAWYRGLL